jgi:hypothetical protein
VDEHGCVVARKPPQAEREWESNDKFPGRCYAEKERKNQSQPQAAKKIISDNATPRWNVFVSLTKRGNPTAGPKTWKMIAYGINYSKTRRTTHGIESIKRKYKFQSA